MRAISAPKGWMLVHGAEKLLDNTIVYGPPKQILLDNTSRYLFMVLRFHGCGGRLKNIWKLPFLKFTLHYCICFAIHQHESAMGVHVFPILNPLPPPSPYHLSGSSQCTSPKHPVSCIEHRLAIRFLYDIIHVSMPFSQISSFISSVFSFCI